MHISCEPGAGTFEIWLELHDPLPLKWARCEAAEIYRKIEGDKVVVVKRLGVKLDV